MVQTYHDLTFDDVARKLDSVTLRQKDLPSGCTAATSQLIRGITLNIFSIVAVSNWADEETAKLAAGTRHPNLKHENKMHANFCLNSIVQ